MLDAELLASKRGVREVVEPGVCPARRYVGVDVHWVWCCGLLLSCRGRTLIVSVGEGRGVRKNRRSWSVVGKARQGAQVVRIEKPPVDLTGRLNSLGLAARSLGWS